MLKDLINEFRAQHGKPPANFCDPQEDYFCHLHCLHMSRVRDIQHAPDELCNGKSEAVGGGSFYRDTRDTVASIVFKGFGKSPGHTAVLLRDNLACAVVQDNWFVYITVRGW